jgi:hypothetical protein
MNIFNYEISPLGVSLLVFGILGFIFSRFKNKQSTNIVSANNGSVAAGRDIKSKINIVNSNQNHDSQKSGLTILDILGIASIIATLIGFGVLIAPLLK